MAATQYQIFYRYLNESVNRVLTNRTNIDWISAEEWLKLQGEYAEYKSKYNDIVQMLTVVNYAYRKDPLAYESAKDRVLKLQSLDAKELKIYQTCKRYEEVADLLDKEKIVEEYCIVEPADSLQPSDPNGTLARKKAERDMELYQYVIDEAHVDNPKYDMVFMYDGIAKAESRTGTVDYNPPRTGDTRQIPYVYYERMKRIKLDPWFLHSTHASLTSAMTRARELVNILGSDGVKIGKVVPLEQYIEIV